MNNITTFIEKMKTDSNLKKAIINDFEKGNIGAITDILKEHGVSDKKIENFLNRNNAGTRYELSDSEIDTVVGGVLQHSTEGDIRDGCI